MALFWRGTATNWSDTTGWSTTDGGGSAGVIPANTDDVNFKASGNGTNCTLDAGTAKVAKTLTINGYTGTLTFNVQLSVSGSITFTTTGFSFAGTTTNKLRMIAAGTWTTNGKTIAQDVEIGGTTTFTSTIAGGAVTTSGDLFLTNTTSTIFSGAFDITASNITISGSQTLTLTGHLVTAGLTTLSDANVLNTSTGKQLQTGGLTLTGACSGTAAVVFTGTGTWSCGGGIFLTNAMTVNTSGTLTLSGTCNYNGSGTTITYTAGTIADGGSGLLTILSSCTITGGTWPAAAVGGAFTLTINTATLVITNALTLANAAFTFAGDHGFTCGTLTIPALTGARTTTLTSGNTYRVTTAITIAPTNTTAANTLTLVSSHATNKVTLTVDLGATQSLIFCVLTRIDASNGQCLRTNSTITTCFNCTNTIQRGQAVNLTGATLTISGVTYDKAGAVLVSCTVCLFRDNGDGTCSFVATVTSDGTTGAYTFTIWPGSSYFAVAFNDTGTHRFDVTDHVLTAA